MDWSCACFSDSEGVEGLTWAWFWDLEHLPNVERKEEEEARVELGLGTSSFCEEEEKPRPCLTERKIIVERLVKIAEEDNEKLLLKLRERVDRMTLLLGPPGSGKTTLLLFQTEAVVLRIYFMVRAVVLIQQHQRQHQEHLSALPSSSDEDES